MSSKPSSPYGESEMERIAREAREFREAETRRIAAEKEEARRATELRKQIERERIALNSGQFRQDAVKEREAIARLKALESQLQKEQDLKSGIGDVSGTAKQFSEMEQGERKRAEERRLLMQQQRALKKTSSRDSADSVSLESFSGEADEFEEIRGTRPAVSRQGTQYFDAAMSQSSLEKGAEFSKQSSVYFDTAMSQSSLDDDGGTYDTSDTLPAETSTPTASNLDPAAGFQTPWQDSIPKQEESKETVYFDARVAKAATPFQNAGQGTVEKPGSGAPTRTSETFQTPQIIPNVDRLSKNTVYYEARTSRQEPIGFEEATSPAGVQARALFSAKGDEGEPFEAESGLDPSAQESIMASQRPRRALKKVKKTDAPSDEELLAHNHVQEACYEIPIEYNPSDGSFTITRDAELSMSTSMAPSRVDGRWSGILEGKASLGPSAAVNSAIGSVGLDYAVSSWSKLSMGMIRGHELYHPLITMGGSLVRQGSVLGVTFYHNASFLHSILLEHSMYSLSFRHLFPNTRWIFSSELSRKQELSLAISNSKVSSRMTCSLREPKRVSARLDLRPRISESRTAHIFGECQSLGMWQVGVSLVQSLHSKIATIGLGVRLYSTRGLEWVFSWNRGDATVRIPVILSRGMNNVHPIQVVFFSLVSFLIQEGIAELWGWHNPASTEEEEAPSKNPTAISTAKARQDAELQKGLMARQAKRKKREEVEKEGLIIHSATYSIEGGEEWDATIPLQFWVNRSSLTLPPKSKSQLLGFYNIVTIKEESKHDLATPPATGSVLWWKAMWLDSLDRPLPSSPERNSGPSPTLQVRYDFQGQAYRIKIQDEQELILPHPRAESL
jgi:hypothetical protein